MAREKRDPVKHAGKEFKRVFDRVSGRFSTARTKLQPGGTGYTAADFATDAMSSWIDAIDLAAVFWPRAESFPVLVLSAPQTAFNTFNMATPGAEIAKATVQLDEAYDPTTPISATTLGQAGAASTINAARVRVQFDEGGTVLVGKLLNKSSNADPNANTGVYHGLVVNTASQDIVIAEVKLLLF